MAAHHLLDLDLTRLPAPLLFWARPLPTWPLASTLAFAALVTLALEAVSLATTAALEAACSPAHRTPPGARLRHRRDCADFTCLALNKLATVAFLLHALRDLHAHAPPPPPSALTALLPVPLLFLAYDAMYAPFHYLLHWAPLYPYIHKHHHRQVAPHRGLDDAVNTHPFEYAVGMWMHLGALWLLRDGLGLAVSPWAVLVFVLGGSVLAAVNHTRMEVEVPYLFNSREHDSHHRFSQFNYARASQHARALH
jgi:sterol desaturase/sphingolipid hydroxylase (fatty acid hydroxylase superfamily)